MTSEDVAPAVDDYNSDDDDCDFDNYYDDCDMDMNDAREEEEKKLDADGEMAKYECLDTFAVERLLNEHVAGLVDVSQVTPSLAKILLHSHNWDGDKVAGLLRTDMDGVLTSCGVKAAPKQTRPSPATHRMTRSSASRAVSPPQPSSSLLPSTTCGVCYGDGEEMKALCCAHSYCLSCWRAHFEARLSEGVASRIECMTPNCSLVCPGEFVVRILDKATLKAKYERFVFRDYVTSHPELRFCVGKDCQVVIRSKEQRAKRVTCAECNTSFCVLCGIDYHAPTSCETIKKWLIKCADDSETANYISAHTKDCPQCHACIEKNGGCNHMQCAKCKHHFCWMCFGDWKTHGSEYYECSRYKENPAVAAEANHMKARRALEKYLHYFERFENHNKSLKLEEELKEKIRRKIDAKVSEHDGTWIDWQHLHEAAGLLTRCRYTLQYTYPYAYYMDGGARKELFEYQQAQLEKEVEELAWAVERPEPTARALLEAHIHRAEHKRLSLLHAFF